MEKKILWTGLLAIALVFAMTAVGCDNNPTGGIPQTVKFESTAMDGNTYILTITENTSRAAYITPKDGDNYELIIRTEGQKDKVSKGTITVGDDGVWTMRPKNSELTFTITITGGEITNITGTIAVEGEDPVSGPGEFDEWTDVTNISQVDGSWKAPASVFVTIEVDVTKEDNVVDTYKVDVNYSINNYIMTFNASENEMSVSGSITMTYSSKDIDKFWPMVKEGLGSSENANVNDANHSLTMTFNNDSVTLSDDHFSLLSSHGVGNKINRDSTKLKAAAGGYEVIYTKQQ
jgi:hypothetical protein